MKRALGLIVSSVSLAIACGGNGLLGPGSVCFDPAGNDGGGATVGSCDPVASFCAPPTNATATSKFTCLARPSTPYIWPDRFVVGFGTDFNAAVYVGTSPQASLQVFNEGLADMHISAAPSVSPAGGKFSISTNICSSSCTSPTGCCPATFPAVVASRQEAYVQVIYTPTAATAPGSFDTATLTIASDAVNTPSSPAPASSLVVGIKGAAVTPRDGG